MLSEHQLRDMLRLQNDINALVDPNWLAAGHCWSRAILVETVEAIEHHGWKWWKHQEMDRDQLVMELVDIWHFALSLALSENPDKTHDELAVAIIQTAGYPAPIEFNGITYHLGSLDLLKKLDLMAGLAAAGDFSPKLFSEIMQDLSFSGDDLYRLYVGKNVLNGFRQENGYKEGSYRKVWDGREDNEWLTEIMLSLNPKDLEFIQKLRTALSDQYQAVA